MHHRSFIVKLGLAALLLCAWPAYAQTDSISVTVYNQNRALISEVRRLNIPKGVRTIEFKDVAETIDPTSLQVRSLTSPNEFKVLDQNYEYDLINVQNVLNKYVGRQLKLVIADPKGPNGAKITTDARLLSNNDKPIFGLDGSSDPTGPPGSSQVYIGNYDAILLPELPEGLRPQPTLVWLVDNEAQEDQKIEVSYLADKMSWKADYVLKAARDNTKGSLSGWVTLDNQCGKSFKNAGLKVVAGEVNLVPRGDMQREAGTRKFLAAAPAEEAMHQEEFFEYHLYTLQRPVDIANRQTKQVSLLQSPEIKLEKQLIGRWNSQPFDSGPSTVQKEKVGVYLKFQNSEQNGLGLPLPKGIVRAYQESEDGTVVFVGEDLIQHTGKNVGVELKTGEAFDVIVERKLTDYRKIGASAIRYAWELRVKNSKDTAQKVQLDEAFPGDWKILQSSMSYQKADARTIRFVVDAPPSGKGKDALITYEAELSW